MKIKILATLLISTALTSTFAFGDSNQKDTDNTVQNTKVESIKEVSKEADKATLSSKVESAKEASFEVTNATVSPSIAGTKNTAAYFSIKNSTSKDLTITDVNSTVANETELHETVKDDKGVITMKKVPNVVVLAGQTFDFKPHSTHIMLLNLKKDLKEGDKVELVINTKEAGSQKVSAVVQKH